MSARPRSSHAGSVAAQLEVEAARDRLRSVALPCLVWGLTAVVVFGGLHLHHLARAQDMDPLVAAVTGWLTLAILPWLLSRRGRRASPRVDGPQAGMTLHIVG